MARSERVRKSYGRHKDGDVSHGLESSWTTLSRKTVEPDEKYDAFLDVKPSLVGARHRPAFRS